MRAVAEKVTTRGLQGKQQQGLQGEARLQLGEARLQLEQADE